jgi:phage terminase large subunit-like protein
VTYPAWLFDDSPLPDPHGMGEKAVAFIRALRHPKSAEADKAFRLDAWNTRLLRRIYGDTDERGRRRIKTVFLLTGKGARKTTLMGAIGALHLLSADFRTEGGSIIAAAADKDQASLAFNEARGIIEAHPRTKEACHTREAEREIVHLKTNSEFKAVSSDAAGKHGLTPTVVLADEVAVWKKRDLWKALRTALVKTPGSLAFIATNSGAGRENLGWEMYDYARKVAEGAIEDPSFLPILFDNPPDADWRDEATWRRAHPGLAFGYPDIDGLRTLAREAENRPSEREDFKRFHCSIWSDSSHATWLEAGVWDALEHDADESALAGNEAWIGVDLSSTADLTAIVACVRQDDRFHLISRFLCPSATIRRRADVDHIPAIAWRDEGHLIATPGAVVDLDAVESEIRALCEAFNVKEIAFDPWGGRHLMKRLQDDGLPVTEMRQGWMTMSPAIKSLERAIIGKTVTTDGNPVLRWTVANAVVEKDKAENLSFHKAKSTGRIDGAVAAAMAVGRASFATDEAESIYDSPERPSGFLLI